MKTVIAIGMVLLLALVACETRTTTIVEDDNVDRVVVVDADPDVRVVADPTPVRAWWRPSTWSTTTQTTTTNTYDRTDTTDTTTSDAESADTADTGDSGTSTDSTTTTSTTTTG